MGKRVLKQWVVYLLIAIVAIILIALMNLQYKNSVRDCINAGHTQNYCENGLK